MSFDRYTTPTEPIDNYINIYLTQSKADIHELFYLTDSSNQTYFNEKEKIRIKSSVINNPITLTYVIPPNEKVKKIRIDPGRTIPNNFSISKIEIVTDGKRLTFMPKDIMNRFEFNQYIHIDSIDRYNIYFNTQKINDKFDPFFYVPNNIMDELEIKSKKDPKFIKIVLQVEKKDLMSIKCNFNNGEMYKEYYKEIFPNSTNNIIYCNLPDNSNLESLIIYPSLKQPNTILFKEVVINSKNIETTLKGSKLQKKFNFNAYVKKVEVSNSDDLEVSTGIIMNTYSPSMKILQFNRSFALIKVGIVAIFIFLLNQNLFTKK